LYMLRQKPEDWKNLQSQQKLSSSQPSNNPSNGTPATSALPAKKPTKRKREPRPENEIDVLFNQSLGKKAKTAIVNPERTLKGFASDDTATSHLVTDQGLNDVFVAIRAAPKDETRIHGRK
jgi:nucleolar protein 9